MAKYRKLGRNSSQRKALLRSQVTALLYHGKIVTTEAKAKEIRKIAESLIALAVRERDNFETVTVTAKVPRKDADGKPSFYFRAAPQFEAPADSKYGWLNNSLFVCAPTFSPDFKGIVLNVWRVK